MFHQACRFLPHKRFDAAKESRGARCRMSIRGPLQPDNIPQTGRGKLTLPHPARGPLSSESSDFVRTNQQAFSFMRQLYQMFQKSRQYGTTARWDANANMV